MQSSKLELRIAMTRGSFQPLPHLILKATSRVILSPLSLTVYVPFFLSDRDEQSEAGEARGGGDVAAVETLDDAVGFLQI